MPFAARLRESLEFRGRQVPLEFSRGDSLEHVLNRHLMTVERLGEGDLVASILLLSADGKRLCYGAGPNLPDSLRGAEMEIGPRAGSCGTAAYLARPVYVADIATDPLWSEYRHLALPHGLRSSWSTPIRASDGAILGTFAILHRSVGTPTREEIAAIDMISGHVAHAILWARTFSGPGPWPLKSARKAPHLKLVGDKAPMAGTEGLLRQLHKLELLAAELDRHAGTTDSEAATQGLRAAAKDCRSLIDSILEQIERRR